jgi:hypothetical protein
MKKIVVPILIFLSSCCFGQEFGILKLDSNISINLPVTYSVRDTLGMKVVYAFIDSGKIIITKMPMIEAEFIGDEEDLLDFYKGVQEGLLKTLDGKLLEDAIIEFRNLKVQKLNFSVRSGNETYMIAYLGFVLNHYKYSFQVMEMESKKNGLGEKILQFIILQGGLSLKNQFH